ncbi:hypothetical protein ABPG74_002143 [Tetrahymena malaccensis]
MNLYQQQQQSRQLIIIHFENNNNQLETFQLALIYIQYTESALSYCNTLLYTKSTEQRKQKKEKNSKPKSHIQKTHYNFQIITQLVTSRLKRIHSSYIKIIQSPQAICRRRSKNRKFFVFFEDQIQRWISSITKEYKIFLYTQTDMYSNPKTNSIMITKNDIDTKITLQNNDVFHGENSNLSRLSKPSQQASLKNNDTQSILKNGNSPSVGGGILASCPQSNATLNVNKYFLNKDEVIISIEGFRFQPQSLYVHCGTKLIWQVKQNKPQYNSLYDSTGPRFFIVSIPQLEEESPPIHENEQYSYVIDQLGSFDMICPNYTRMKGSLIVVDKSTTINDLTKDQQPKYFMEHVDEYKYASQNLSSSLQQQLYQLNSSNIIPQAQIFQQQPQEISQYLASSAIENSGKSYQNSNPIAAYYSDRCVSYPNSNTYNPQLSNSLAFNNQLSQNNLQKNQLYYQMSNSAVLSSKEQRIDQSNTEYARKNYNEKIQLQKSASFKSLQPVLENNEKLSQECFKQLQNTKQEKILTKIIDSNKSETAESEKITKQFLQELQNEQNSRPSKKKNAHYLQLYKDDFQEDAEEDEDDLECELNKKKRLESDNKKKQNLTELSESKRDTTSKQHSLKSQANDIEYSPKKSNEEGKLQRSHNKTFQQNQNSEKHQKDIQEPSAAKKEKDNSCVLEQSLLSTPKRKSLQKREIDNLKKKSIKIASNSNSCNTSYSSQKVSSQQQIQSIREDSKELKQSNSQGSQKKIKLLAESQNTNQDNFSEKHIDDAQNKQTQQCCLSSSTVTTNTTVIATEDKEQTKYQSQQVTKTQSLPQFLSQNVQVKKLKKINTNNQANKRSELNSQKKQERQEDLNGYNSDYECQNEEEDEENDNEVEDVVNDQNNKKNQALNQTSNPASSLYFKGHSFQYFRNHQSNQYAKLRIPHENDEYDDDEEEEEYDCNTIISEEDASVYASKENSLVYRRNNSSSNLHSSGSQQIGSDVNPNNSFTASQTLNKRFTKRIRRNYRKKPKIGVLSESYLKSPAQSILTTAESSKYSDTTKQLSQKGDFDLEGNDIHERGSLLFQHKYSQKRRASTDQTIQESRYHNNNDDSDTRSIKSLKNERNIVNNNNPINNSSNNSNNACGSTYVCQNQSCNSQINNQSQYQQECCHESDNEGECVDLFDKYNCNKFIKVNNTCCSHLNSANIFDFLKQQSKIQFLNFTENFCKQENQKKIFKQKKEGNNNSTSSSQSNGYLEGLQENRDESKSVSSQNTNNLTHLSNSIQDQTKPKIIQNYKINTSVLNSEIATVANQLPLTEDKNEEIQEQISFIKSFLEQRYEIESWLLEAGGADDLGEIEDY